MFATGHVDVYTDGDAFAPPRSCISQKQIKQIIVDEISSGRAKPGEKVPSIRILSAKIGVSQAIIRRVFAQLFAEGWLEMRHGSGTFVSESASVLVSNNEVDESDAKTPEVPEVPDAPESPLDSEVVSATRWQTNLHRVFDGELIYGLDSVKCDLNFLPGAHFSDLSKGSRWDSAIDLWKSDCARLPGLTEPAGMIELRHEIADWLRRAKGMTCTMNDIVIVNGAQEARSLLARLLIDRGTNLVFEEPGSVVHKKLFQAYGANIIPVSVDDSGIVVDELNAITEGGIIFATPVAQFPTGAVFSRVRKQKIAEWALATKSIVIEDESSSEFIYESRITPPIASLEAAGRTVYIGGFSQMLPPEWQIGFIVAPPSFRAPLLRMKSLTNRCTSFVVQALMTRLLQSGFVQDFTRRLQRQNDERRQAMIGNLRDWKNDDVAFSPVKGGTNQTIWFKSGIDDIRIVKACAANGIAVTPVSPCFMRQPARSGLILNFSAINADDMKTAMNRLLAVLQRCDIRETLITDEGSN